MNCRVARRRLLDREIGAPAITPDADLARHLQVCGGCASEAKAGLRLARELASLRTVAPFEVDVVERVRAGLANRPAFPASLPAVDRRAVLWLAAGLTAIFVALAWGTRNIVALAEGARETWTLAAAFGRVVFLMFSAFGRTLEATGSVVARWISISASALPERMMFGFSLENATLCAALFMTLLTLLALARDIRRADRFPTKGT